jgi:hypothetical protein
MNSFTNFEERADLRVKLRRGERMMNKRTEELVNVARCLRYPNFPSVIFPLVATNSYRRNPIPQSSAVRRRRPYPPFGPPGRVGLQSKNTRGS